MAKTVRWLIRKGAFQFELEHKDTLKENGGSGGARTRNLCRDRAAL